jgi:hypothetical protein
VLRDEKGEVRRGVNALLALLAVALLLCLVLPRHLLVALEEREELVAAELRLVSGRGEGGPPAKDGSAGRVVRGLGGRRSEGELVLRVRLVAERVRLHLELRGG